ncbi:acyl carrier protein [Streptomyces huiliensis]|uniref:acyl carrier protein n=1 Tax=Streptomyces huiliensis TaxID=2876027 RepID=UPI001CC0F915|nr:acyl carrier protein [Streptomyces huiliensis]MBZ4324055.1 acyl carrier protein [Streptomyces huiliensis]
MSTVEERVKRVIVEQLNVKPEEVTDNASFGGDLGADSLDLVEPATALEMELAVDIPDEEAAEISTVRGAVDWFEAHRR